jgi:cystathionine beta-lyase/cystathionine gamma-synthase
MNAWLILRGLRTLEIRLKKSQENGVKVASWLAENPKIRKVNFPFHPSHPQFDIARKQMSGCGGLLSFELDTDELHKIDAFCNNLKYFLLACSWGSYESLCFPTAALINSTNYSNNPFKKNLIRIYCGLEDSENLINDLENALFLSSI